MTAVDVCLCILLVAAAFALVSLGVTFIRSMTTLEELNQSLTELRTTMNKANEMIENVNYKLELLDAPFERVSNIFQDDSRRPSLLGRTFLNAFRSNRRKKKRK